MIFIPRKRFRGIFADRLDKCMAICYNRGI